MDRPPGCPLSSSFRSHTRTLRRRRVPSAATLPAAGDGCVAIQDRVQRWWRVIARGKSHGPRRTVATNAHLRSVDRTRRRTGELFEDKSLVVNRFSGSAGVSSAAKTAGRQALLTDWSSSIGVDGGAVDATGIGHALTASETGAGRRNCGWRSPNRRCIGAVICRPAQQPQRRFSSPQANQRSFGRMCPSPRRSGGSFRRLPSGFCGSGIGWDAT